MHNQFRHGALSRPAEGARERVSRWEDERVQEETARGTRPCPPPPQHSLATSRTSKNVSTPADRSTLVEPATRKVFQRQQPLKNVAGSVFSGGMVGNIMMARQAAPVPVVPPAVKPYEPRGDHFYAALAVEQPRKYGTRGTHSHYGGPVVCHPCEQYEAVTVNHQRDMDRKALDGSRGERGFGGREYVAVLEGQRGNGPGEGIPRGMDPTADTPTPKPETLKPEPWT